MEGREGFAEVNGARLYYEIAGAGHPLVLIHGFSLDAQMWNDQFDSFAHHYQVIRYDARGFGRSSLPADDSYLSGEDLAALLIYLGITHAHLVGLSKGGGIAVDLALTHPSLVDAMVLVASGLGGYQFSQEQIGAIKKIRSTAKSSGIQAAKDLWLKAPLFGPGMEKPAVATQLRQIITGYSGWHFINDDPAGMPDPAPAQRLHEVSAPTLVIIGDRDGHDSQAIAQLLSRNIPGARTEVMSGVGHMCNMEDTSRFNQMVLEFLAEF